MSKKVKSVPMNAPNAVPYHEVQRVSIEKAKNGYSVHHSNTGMMMVAKTSKEAMKHAKKLLK